MGKDQAIFCNCENHKMGRFIEVCLLLLLYYNVGYGYGLIKQLEYFGFYQEELNVSTLYKTLRKMEKEKLVSSSWEKGGPGPRRRVYEITESGRKSLEHWIKILEIRKSRIDKLIKKYKDIVKIREERTK